MPVRDVIAFFTEPGTPQRHKSYPVVNAKGGVVAMVARADVLRWTMEGWPAGETLGEILSDQELVLGYDDELAGAVADRMAAARIGRMPILRRSDNTLVGLVARRDLLRVRANVVNQENKREALIRLLPRRSAS
jgi:CBS domain-containing protein